MRVLALDVGDKRIGVALSDPTNLLASPLTTVRRAGGPSDLPSDVEEVARLAAEHDVREIVIGLPLSLSGRPGAQAARVAQFARALAQRVAIPIVTVDERYSSVQAERLLRESGIEPSRNKARVDSAAAAVILQAYLDAKRANPSPNSSQGPTAT